MSKVIWEPQPKQKIFMSRGEDEVLFGGSAGGGKSDCMVIEATRQVNIPHYKGLILRKTFPQLRELIDKSLSYYPRIFPGCKYNSSEHTWRFKSGAKIIFGSMNHPQNKIDYQGQAFDFIGFDELTHFSYDEYIYLKSRNRPNGKGTRCYIRSTANPGGVGHGWVKDRFITAAPPMTTIWEKSEVPFPDGHTEILPQSRIFVPSSVFDNQALLANDPQYIARLASMPEAEKRALLFGDWDSFTGMYFKAFKNDPTHYKDRRWTHVIEPFEIPSHWTCYRSFDWGYFRPSSCGYYFFDENGVAYRALEIYFTNGTPNQGTQQTPQEVFKTIHDFEKEHRWLKGRKIIGVADPAIWNAQMGESIAEVAAKNHVYFTKGDHARIPGWLQCQYRLSFDDNGLPMFYVFNTCRHFIRTIPTLVFDDKQVEDLNSDGEDHIADEWRYCMMARPISPRVATPKDPYYASDTYKALSIQKEMLTEQTVRQKVEIIT